MGIWVWIMELWERWRTGKEERRKRHGQEFQYVDRREESILTLHRKWFSDKSTIGELLFDNEFQCHTLEDTVRDPNKDGVLQKEEKVYGVTAIPSGEYEVVISFSNKFKKKLPLLVNVPYFTGIRIHPGNEEKHSFGCILVGEYNPEQPDFVSNSRAAFGKIFKRIENSLNYRKLFIRIQGGPTA